MKIHWIIIDFFCFLLVFIARVLLDTEDTEDTEDATEGHGGEDTENNPNFEV